MIIFIPFLPLVLVVQEFLPDQEHPLKMKYIKTAAYDVSKYCEVFEVRAARLYAFYLFCAKLFCIAFDYATRIKFN